MRSSRSLPALLALGLFAVFLAIATFRAAYETARHLALLVRVQGETPYQERSRTYGRDYADAIETLRKTIPRDGAYVLVNGDPTEQGGPFWIKFDLAPRRAVFLGTLDELDKMENPDRLRQRIPRAARWVVIAYGPYRRPVLMERYKFMQELKGASPRERKSA